MNSRKLKLISLSLLLGVHWLLTAQVSFTLPPSTCINNTLALSANTGTLTSPQITWLTSPNALLSNSLSANTSITFTSAGSYSILLVVISGTNLAFSQSSIQVFANPTPTLYSFPPAVCPSGSFTLSAILPPMGLPNYTFILPGNSPVITGSVPSLPTVAPSSSAFPAVYSVSVEVAGCSGISSTAVQQLSLNPFLTANPNPVCSGFVSTLVVFPNTLSNYTFSVLSPSFASFPNGSNPVFTVSPTQATIYQVLVDSANCTGSATLNMNISPPLNIGLTASSLTNCIIMNSPKLSKPLTLTASGANNYSWFPYDPFNPCVGNCSQIIVRPQSNTCYTVNGVTAVCSGSAVICLGVIPQFTIAVSPVSATICSGQTLTLISGSIGPGAVGPPSAYTYSWTEAPNAPPISMSSYLTPSTNVFPQNSTTYTVDIADTQSCVSAPQVATVIVLACNGINEENAIEFLTLIPNPVKDICNVQITGSPIHTLELLDLSGKLQFTQFLEAKQSVQLDFSSISSGYYLLKVYALDGKINFLKVLKQD